MAGKYLWITLFVTIQISISLCRSTEKPNGEDKDVTVKSIGLNEMGKILEASNFIDDTGNTIPKDAAIPSQMAYYVSTRPPPYISYIYNHAPSPTVITAAIIFSIFIFFTLVYGCIMLFCCEKKPRRGFIVNTNTGGQTRGMQQPGTVMQGTFGNVYPIQEYPTPYVQTQQQNICPPPYEAK